MYYCRKDAARKRDRCNLVASSQYIIKLPKSGASYGSFLESHNFNITTWEICQRFTVHCARENAFIQVICHLLCCLNADIRLLGMSAGLSVM